MDAKLSEALKEKRQEIHNLQVAMQHHKDVAAETVVLLAHVRADLSYVKTNAYAETGVKGVDHEKLIQAHLDAATAICEKITERMEFYR